MTIKRLAIMGVLMIASVVFTLTQVKVLQDPPGVTTRWFDGTKEKAEEYYQDGSLASRTTYGDDGKTIITYERWNAGGILTQSKIRRPDGKVEEKYFESGVLIGYTLWSGDMTYTLIERRFTWSGQLAGEVIKTEDGKVTKESRKFHSNGQLAYEHLILGNADQTINQYHLDGTPINKRLLRGNGSQRMEDFHANGKISKEVEVYNNFGNGLLEVKTFTDSSVLLRHLNRPGDGNETLSVFKEGKIEFKQYFRVDSLGRVSILAVELFEFGNDTPSRKISQETSGIKVEIFNKDGSLKSVKLVKNKVVVKQFDYTSDEQAQPVEVEPVKLAPIIPEALQDQGEALRLHAGGVL